ncbi:MAG: histone deacetylase family protein [Alphaproteobacteria bacterium]
MTTALYTHETCIRHDPGMGHPESSDRLKVVLAALDEKVFASLDRIEAPLATIEQIARVHPIDHVTRILDEIPKQGYARIDADTVVSPASGEAALRAAGAVCAAVDAVIAGTVKNAFCAIRPPGHHAEPAIPMGFCVFNSIAVGAAQARSQHGMERIAAIDFDVHHGNGTQAIFYDEPNLFYASTHQSPLYPGTGSPRETGCSNNIVNVPLPPGAGSDMFREAMTLRVLPALRRFAPEILLVSAGFDAHADDPLAGLRFTDDDYRWVTDELARVADECCEGRLVSALEGGYDLAALSRCAAIHVKTLMQA